MSRTTLCTITAALLAAAALGVMLLRHQVLGEEIHLPAGPGTYKVTLLVRGKSQGNAKVQMLCPLDFHKQHVFREDFASDDLNQRAGDGHARDRRSVLWSQKPGGAKGPIEARYECYCSVDMEQPTAPMTKLARQIYESPRAGEYVQAEALIDPHDPKISDLARDLTEHLDRPVEQVRALFHYVTDKVAADPAAGNVAVSAVACQQAGRGDAAAQSRLLTALCRSRGIPARLVTGIKLGRRDEQTAHHWVEAWVGDHWMPMCPFHQHLGRVPPTYLVFAFGDLNLVRGHNVRDLDCACLVEPRQTTEPPQDNAGWLHQLFRITSLDAPPPGERHLIEFLLLLPVAALIICVCRNVIGMQCFGTFAPALIGLAFREWESLPGILVFVSIILVGWSLRRVLDRYHLLQVPRSSFLLSLVVMLLLATVIAANLADLAFTRYFSLFPMVILTGMIERFWTMETEDGAVASFKTLMSTFCIACLITLVISWRVVVNQLMHYPETIGLIMACQLLLGRYTGYRLSELWRFRDFIDKPASLGGESGA
jgi:hypothetical protein